MGTDRIIRIGAITAAFVLLGAGVSALPQPYGIGITATQAEINAWNDDVEPNGAGLPSGSGSIAAGRQVYSAKCIACHGQNGQGGPKDRLVGGQGTLASTKPVKTIGSFWPFAPTVFDYVRRAMPSNAPGTLSNDEVYAVTAYLLYLNNLVPQNAVMNAKTLPKVMMPNRNGFIWKDPRPDAP
jgi:mono/diheme cytochrome c family protein